MALGASIVPGVSFGSFLTALALGVTLLGCAGSAENRPLEIDTGAHAETTVDGLVRMRGSGFSDIWAKPNADIASYSSLLIGDVRVAYKRKPMSRRYAGTKNNFALDARQLERLQAMLRRALVERVEKTEAWTLADGPGTRVLLLEPNIIDLVITVPTDPAPNSRAYTTSTGEMTLLLELRDSLTEELLARLADRREARQTGQGKNDLYWSNVVTNQQAVKRVFDRWARLFMARLDTAQGLAPMVSLEDDEDVSGLAGRGRAGD